MGLFDFLKKERDGKSSPVTGDLSAISEIRTHLKGLCERNFNFIATINEEPTAFGSIFLELPEKNNSIVIDVLMPKYGNSLIENSKKVKIDYTVDGVMHSFGTKFLGTVEGKFPSIIIASPSIIRRIQRRKSFRVSPPIDNQISVELAKGTIEKAVDIGEGGLSFYTRKEISPGKIFDKVTFSLPACNKQITAKAVVKDFIKGLRGTIKNRCGIEFIDIEMHDRDSIAYYVIIRQKETAQRRI
ncbi:MAG: flagellar brake protein [Nitrospinae bacterium]|nr:flagellar brake protein [Nitrospinota bacterium]